MAVYSRISVQDGATVPLRTVYTDTAGNFVSPTTPPVVYIYDADIDDSVFDAELEALTFTSAVAGPLTPTEITTGFFELLYAVPSGGSAGLWRDIWVSTMETTSSMSACARALPM